MNLLAAPRNPLRVDTRLSWSVTAVFFAVTALTFAPCTEVLAATAHHQAKPAVVKSRNAHIVRTNGSFRLTRKHGRHATHQRADHGALAPQANRAGIIAPAVLRAIRVAQQKANADPDLLLAIALKESSFNPAARNRHSTARGLLQFTSATWLTVVRDFGARYGLGRYAAAIETDRTGRLSVKNRRLRRVILALRDDPGLQALLTTERLNQARRSLELHLGRPARGADLYFLHLLGPTGATQFLTELAEHPDASSVATVGSVATPNAGLFIKDGQPVTVAAAYAGVQMVLDEEALRYADLFQPKPSLIADTR